MSTPDLPGDPAAPGEDQTGQAPCRTCAGTGRVEGRPCPDCDGSGVQPETVGDA